MTDLASPPIQFCFRAQKGDASGQFPGFENEQTGQLAINQMDRRSRALLLLG